MVQRAGITRAEILDSLNRMAPAMRDALLGNVLYDLLDGHNGLLDALDAESRAVANASGSTTLAGTIAATDTVSLTFTNAGIPEFPITVGPTLTGGTTATVAANSVVAALNANAAFKAANMAANNVAGVITIIGAGKIHNTTVITGAVAGGGVTSTIAAAGAMTGGIGVVTKARRTTFGVTPPESR